MHDGSLIVEPLPLTVSVQNVSPQKQQMLVLECWRLENHWQPE
jgi:hypothetical protein